MVKKVKNIRKINKHSIITFILGMLGLLVLPSYADTPLLQEGLVPGESGGLYYEIGGGDVTPLPYAPDNTSIDLNVDGNAGVGYNCGVFNPQASIVNSLNSVESSFESMLTQVISDGEGALMELPAYELEQAMPDLYKLIQDGVSNGQFDFNVSTKSCQEMVSDIGAGQNPYNDFMLASLGDKLKYQMSLADPQTASDSALGDSNQDINAAMKIVNQDNGRSGIQWVRSITKSGQLYAGGQGQPLIYLTYDTVVAGYNVLIGDNRPYDDTSAPAKTDTNARLVATFANPTIAGQWVAKVVGEQEVTTYAGGQKQNTPGIGLLNDVQSESEQVKQLLQSLVDGSQPITLDNLKLISPPKIILNNEVIQMLRKQTNTLMQTIYLNKIAEEVAVARVIDKAKLGLQLLEIGSQVPTIYANGAATSGIKADEDRMREWIDDLRDSPKDNEEFVGHTVTALLSATQTQEAISASIRPSETPPPLMEEGAVKSEQ